MSDHRSLSRAAGVVALLTAAFFLLGLVTDGTKLSSPASAQPGEPFRCFVDAGDLTWSDHQQSKYWAYKSTDNGASYQWLGRTFGATTLTDPAPTIGAKYQVHYNGIPRIDCSVTTPEAATPGGTTALPGVVEAENYFQGVDTTPGNQGRATEYSDDVDVWPMYNGDGHIIGLTENGESTSYRVSTATVGSYRFAITNASGGVGSTVTLLVDGEPIGEPITLAPTSGWWSFVLTDLGAIDLTPGEHTVTVLWGAGQSNFDNLTVIVDDDAPTTCVAKGQVAETALTQAQCDALTDLVPRDETGDPCHWPGVSCNDDGTTVTAVTLWGRGPAVMAPTIGSLTGLIELDLGFNKLQSLPPEIGNLTNLETLDLSDNELTSLPAEIGNLTALTKLNLGGDGYPSRDDPYLPEHDPGNDLTDLPPEIGNLTALTELNLSENFLTTVPPEIGNLTALTKLTVTTNRLAALPPEIGTLTGLVAIGLAENQLTALPTEFANLRGISKLDLSNNALTSVPRDIANVTALDLGNNNLTTLSADIGDLTGLTSLVLSGNALTTLPTEIGNLTSLTELDVRNNKLTTLPAEFGNLTELSTGRSLDLTGNELVSLPPEIGNLTGLTGLILRNNNLTIASQRCRPRSRT